MSIKVDVTHELQATTLFICELWMYSISRAADSPSVPLCVDVSPSVSLVECYLIRRIRRSAPPLSLCLDVSHEPEALQLDLCLRIIPKA